MDSSAIIPRNKRASSEARSSYTSKPLPMQLVAGFKPCTPDEQAVDLPCVRLHQPSPSSAPDRWTPVQGSPALLPAFSGSTSGPKSCSGLSSFVCGTLRGWQNCGRGLRQEG